MASAFDLFISYSSRDKAIADALLAGLETDRIRCWMAPRNVETGKTWAGSILRGIRDADIFLLILTPQSNQSAQVLNEVERAVSLNKSIICYRSEDVVLSDDLELFLSSKHWIEASGQPVSATLPRLTTDIRSLLARRQTAPLPSVDLSAAVDDREQCLRNGKRAYLAREFSLASDYFNEAAEGSSGEALFYLGEMHRKGEGVKRSPAKAKHYFTNALEKGSLLGNWGLARMLDDADELPDRARHYYEQARETIAEKAVEEDAYGCYLYSLMYAEGKGLQKDAKRAERWLDKAKENGYQPATATSVKPVVESEPKAAATRPAPVRPSEASSVPRFAAAPPAQPKRNEPVASEKPQEERSVGQNTTSDTVAETALPWQKILIGIVMVGAFVTGIREVINQPDNGTLPESAVDSSITMSVDTMMVTDSADIMAADTTK